MKNTYYIVQIGEYAYAQYDGGIYSPARDIENAAHLSLSKARDVYELEKRFIGGETPRRFPRIIKVSTEMKTITNRR